MVTWFLHRILGVCTKIVVWLPMTSHSIIPRFFFNVRGYKMSNYVIDSFLHFNASENVTHSAKHQTTQKTKLQLW